LGKLMSVFFVGQLVGLPTLKSILTKLGIKSSGHHVKYKKLCKDLTDNKIRCIFEHIFELHLSHKLGELSAKDSCIWSRELATVVLDDSIFKQWLTQELEKRGLDCAYYGCFFSGQFKAAVFGFKVVTLGLSIDGVFYPLYFDFVKQVQKTEAKKPEAAENEAEKPDSLKNEAEKTENEVKKTENEKKEKVASAKEVAVGLVNRWGIFAEKMKSSGIKLPKLNFSCDSGYNDDSLCKACEINNLAYISVPKKTHIFIIEGKRINLNEWIKNDFETKEKAHEEQQKDLPKEQKTPFTYRAKAHYESQKKDVILLAFRLNGSKKVSVIYTTHLTIHAKTLRRHWFQRTYIEQFFKTLKHILKIQEARVSSKEDFEIKLWRFAFVAWHAQQLVRFLRKKIKDFAKMGFISIQRILNSDKEYLDLLQCILDVKK
jgi:hypothetical protein